VNGTRGSSKRTRPWRTTPQCLVPHRYQPVRLGHAPLDSAGKAANRSARGTFRYAWTAERGAMNLWTDGLTAVKGSTLRVGGVPLG
jgi:hypothetical protein